MKKKFVLLSILLLFVISLFLSVLNIKTTWVSAGEYPAIYIDPAITNTTALGPGTSFTISIKTDYNGSDIWGWDFTLTYNPLALNFIDVINGDLITEAVDPDFDFKLEQLNETTLRALASFSAYPKPVPLTSGPGTFANVTFTVVRKAASNLTLGPDTVLQGYTDDGNGHLYNIIDASKPPGATEPPYGSDHIQHGYFDNRFLHDVAVVSVTAPAKAAVGDLVHINMTVANIGKSVEVVNVTIRYDTTYIDSESVALLVGESETVLLNWNTTGTEQRTYTINATATVEGEGDPADNWKTTDFLSVIHDVAVVKVTAPVKAAVGSIVSISVEVENIGASPEDVEVVVSYDGTYIDSENVTLAKGANTTRSLSWNTTDVTQGTYTINGIATLTPNNKTDTWTVDNMTKSFITTIKPVVPDSEEVYVNETLMTKPANYTIDYKTGEITFTIAPGVGAEIKAIYLYIADDDPTDNWKTTTILLSLHNVAVVSVTAPVKAAVGSLVPINMTVANIGASKEDVNVTIRYDATYIDSQIVTLDKGANTTLSLSWNTTDVTQGTYTINATATVEGDVDPADNWKTTTILLAVHKVAVASISAPYTVYIGENVTIEVLVINTGGFNETFEVVVSYDGTYIDSENVTLASYPSPAEALYFTWNTTGVDPASYTINATATVEGDVNPNDNWKTTTIDVKPPPPGTIAGTVTDASTGLPIQGANVTANADYTNTTDADGYYMIAGVPPGDYNITASAVGYYSNSTSETVISEETITVDFELTPTPTPGIPWHLYVAAAGVVAIIIVAVAFYFLRIRKPKPT